MELGQRENRYKPVLVREKVEVYYHGTMAINLTEKMTNCLNCKNKSVHLDTVHFVKQSDA